MGGRGAAVSARADDVAIDRITGRITIALLRASADRLHRSTAPNRRIKFLSHICAAIALFSPSSRFQFLSLSVQSKHNNKIWIINHLSLMICVHQPRSPADKNQLGEHEKSLR